MSGSIARDGVERAKIEKSLRVAKRRENRLPPEDHARQGGQGQDQEHDEDGNDPSRSPGDQTVPARPGQGRIASAVRVKSFAG